MTENNAPISEAHQESPKLESEDKAKSGDMDNFEEVHRAELEYIAEYRVNVLGEKPNFPHLSNTSPENGLVGLALSGGGIRSATFNLGLLQTMAWRNVLRRCDYLSTVSGGGYIGSCLTSLLSGSTANEASVIKGEFPFRFDRRPGGGERDEVNHLRTRSNYLAFRPGLFSFELWGLIGAYLSGLALSLMSPLGLLLLVVWGFWGLSLPGAGGMVDFIGYAAIGSLALLLLLRFSSAWQDKSFAQRMRLYNYFYPTLVAVFVMAGAVWLVVWVFAYPELQDFINKLIEGLEKFYKESRNKILGGGAVAGLAALVPRLLAGGGGKGARVHVRIFSELSRMGKLVLVLLALIGVNFLFFEFFKLPNLDFGGVSIHIGWLAAIFLGISLLTNQNRVSMHHFYRDKLSRAYIIRRKTDGKEEDKKIESNETLTLPVMLEKQNGPYHLINATANLPSSDNPQIAGRGADSFLFSKFYVGSKVIGYRKSAEYMGGKTRLATAMAISGAAVGSGRGDLGGRGLGLLMTLLNLRTNRWMPNPRNKRNYFTLLGPVYWLKEFLGRGNETNFFLNLSDGGHYENLGVLPLLERRCAWVIASDSGADPDFKFEDLVKLIRKARIDLGVNLQIDLSPLRPDPDTRFSHSHHQFGTIEYPDGKSGVFLYIKSTMTGKEAQYAQDVQSYREANKDFPDQTTADQFFSENQFESYRKLGEYAGLSVFTLDGDFPDPREIQIPEEGQEISETDSAPSVESQQKAEPETEPSG